MKIIISTLLLCIIFVSNSYSQSASTYFPSSPGYKWFYKNTPLDSLNIPQTAAETFQVDSFAVIQSYQGLQANIVLSKSGLLSVNQNTPYTDTNYYNFQTTNGWYYLNVLNLIDSIPFLDTTSLIGFLKSFEKWYSVYRFSQSVNSNYTIFSRDTTITFDTLTLPLRVSATGRRLNDQSVSTVNGTYLAKKFLITFALSYLIQLPPPFPPIAIPVFTRPDTTYIAQNIWIVKDVMPSSVVDLSAFGVPISFTIPGVIKELSSTPVGINMSNNIITDNYTLYQNFPNPFNPETNISYNLPSSGHTVLKVYDALGSEVVSLVNEIQSRGSYKITFDGSNLSSGIYYYKLISGNFSEFKKMILLK
ncbi:MAG: T9SS type A sorting domain-containing protein [Ignavibacteria bacterium]